MSDNLHDEIRRKLADGTITDSTKEQLEKYVAALCRGGANNSYGSSFHAICGTVQTLLKSKISEEGEAGRHLNIQQKLEELKKPHRPSFWLLVASVTLALIAAVAGVLALPQVQKAVFGNPQSQGQNKQSQPSEKQSQLPKSEQSQK